jgi:L-ascorbate 6-phosphate lactonase
MQLFSERVRETQVEPGSLAIFWLAQAGFVFKTPEGTIIYTDPYLTDYVQRALPEYGLGFKRIMPKLIEVDEVETDYVVSTHSHQDHLDVDALSTLSKDQGIHFVGAPDCREHYVEAGVPKERFTIVHQGETVTLGDLSLTGIYADHGELAPDALGIMFDFDGIKVWQVGDTAYRPEMWQDVREAGIDIILPPINGAFGNLNEVEAAQLARDVHAKVAIPCHFWMFPLHYGNPMGFLEACQEIAPDVQAVLLTQGERFVYRK